MSRGQIKVGVTHIKGHIIYEMGGPKVLARTLKRRLAEARFLRKFHLVN